MSYDVKCYHLAQSFLSDRSLDFEAYCHELAQHIQDTIEAFIKEKEQQP